MALSLTRYLVRQFQENTFPALPRLEPAGGSVRHSRVLYQFKLLNLFHEELPHAVLLYSDELARQILAAVVQLVSISAADARAASDVWTPLHFLATGRAAGFPLALRGSRVTPTAQWIPWRRGFSAGRR